MKITVTSCKSNQDSDDFLRLPHFFSAGYRHQAIPDNCRLLLAYGRSKLMITSFSA
jgi:hypothetical protein